MNKIRASNKPGDRPPRTHTGASVRGKTISQPIPFPDDDEFPIRTPGAGIAMPLSADGHDQVRIRESIATQLDNTAHQTGIAVSDFVDPPLAPPPPVGTMSTPTPSQHAETQSRRTTNAPSTLRNSTASVPSNITSMSKPQRKKSSMRSVFGRLFGKKRKGNGGSGSGSSSAQELGPSDVVRAGQHRSDPSALNRSPQDTANPQKRSASLPINEFNRALRSHSIIADDIPRQSAEQSLNRDSLPADGRRRSRRATTPSRLWTPNKTPGYVDWTGLSPRPASSHPRASRVASDPEADASIGTAVTSGSHPNRRSRSLGELRGMIGGINTTRRRSDEIRYWRESYDPGVISPMSSNKPDENEPMLDEMENARGQEPPEQPQPFNFGPLVGMKITQAASLETRVHRLEERMGRVERLIPRRFQQGRPEDLNLNSVSRRRSASRLGSSIPRPATGNSEVSLPRRSRQQQQIQARPQTQAGAKRSSSYGSSRPSTMSTHTTYHPSFDLLPSSTLPIEETVMNTSNARPLSTSTTIRGGPSSSPTLPKEAPLTGEHFASLFSMIQSEQAARQHLEAVVHGLQQQILALRSASHQQYPTPDSDQPTDPLIDGGPDFQNFEEDSSEDGRYVDSDVFKTPNEERGSFGDECFGDTLNGTELKGTPRTLSLSQITLGRGMQPSLNF